MSVSRKIAVVGLGYVGLPIAVHFGKKQKVTGFDINAQRIAELKTGFDRNRDLALERVELRQIACDQVMVLNGHKR